MDPLLTVVIRTATMPLLARQDDGSWHVDLEDASTTIVLTTAQVRHLIDDYLAQSLEMAAED